MDDAAYQRFVAATLETAAMLEDMPGAPQQSWQVSLSLRMWVSVLQSVHHFVNGQRVRDAHRAQLSAAPPETFKPAGREGDPDYFLWYQIQRRELDNTSELIRLLRNGGLEYFAHARQAADEDTFVLGPDILETLEQKRKIMRAHWLDAQRYLASPHR